METDRISIIIPVYNVEAYIHKCLNSVINQTYTNLEILLIDDGSTDDSGRICDEYAENDSRIRVFHKENGGLSTALNFGLECFSGGYLGFVDSDDWIEPDMYESLVNTIKKSRADISVVSYFKDIGSEVISMTNKMQIPGGLIETKEMLLYPLKRDYYMGFCSYLVNKLFTANVIKTSGLTFENQIKYGMDVLFFYTLVSKNKCTGVYTDKPLYHYLQRDTSISKTKAVNIKTDILTAYKEVEKRLESFGYADIVFWVRGFYCHHASVCAEIAYKNNDRDTLLSMQEEIRTHLNDYIETNREFPEKLERINRLLNLEVH